ncbi:class I SAM-dependent methyltransferase [Corallococcus caeni]|uniref:Class I SAM-dependent methyltransferase n=1 Tax=Corallococcus caeni TaxID=3082388 RepID=A0ABQ6QN51_9BACT|nr:class I SAM-dependent methyltransferase [Corallococcus sp. NO1]
MVHGTAPETVVNFIENETSEKLRGGYYTDSTIATYLLRWVMDARPRSILEPSCGDGAFIRAMRELPCDAMSTGLRRLVGCELDAAEAAKARRAALELPGVKSDIVSGDFMDWVLERLHKAPEFDAIVGNPPFVRYQYLTDMAQHRAERIIKHFGLRFTKHTNAWVPFVIGSLALLNPGGRLAMVVPAELLHVLHSDSVRQFLLKTCSRILVLDPEELWFENALQGVVLLLAEKRRTEDVGDKLGRVAITRIRGRDFLAGSPVEHFQQAEYVPGDALPAKWMLALLTARERSILDRIRASSSVRSFSQLASASVGIVTGANKFFLVPDAVLEEYGLQDYAHPMFGRSEHVSGVIYDKQSHAENKRRGFPTNFLWFKNVPREGLAPGVRRYIELGESQMLHQRFKCRIREPWYSVPSVFTAPVGMLKRSHDYPRLVLNQLDAFTTDTAYRIVPKAVSARQLVYTFVNSLTALCAELEGRHYGGGVLELVPSEINRLLIPVLPEGRDSLSELNAAFRESHPPEEVLVRQDRKLLGAIGLSTAEQQELQQAWWKLRNRRHRTRGEEEAQADASSQGSEELDESVHRKKAHRVAATSSRSAQ